MILLNRNRVAGRVCWWKLRSISEQARSGEEEGLIAHITTALCVHQQQLGVVEYRLGPITPFGFLERLFKVPVCQRKKRKKKEKSQPCQPARLVVTNLEVVSPQSYLDEGPVAPPPPVNLMPSDKSSA